MPARAVLAVVVAAVALQVGLVLTSAADAPEGAALSLIQAGAEGPSASAIAADFAERDADGALVSLGLPDRLGHDGQQNYAIARDPWHLASTAAQLDRPHYRLQRPLLPLLAWALHPSGGGPGLVWAFVVVNAAALALLAWSTVRLVARFDAPRWLPALVVLLPLAYYPLRISTSDVLALALVLAAADAHLAGRSWRAAAWGVAAVLAKESTLLVLAGLWLARRDRRSLPVAAVPTAVVVTLAVALRLLVDDDGPSVVELGMPLRGLWQSFDTYWLGGEHTAAAFSVVLGLVLAVVALASPEGRRHPLAPALALQVAFTTLLGVDVLGLTANGTRTTAPLQVLAVLVAASASVRRPSGARASGR